MLRTAASLLSAALFCVSCNDPAIEPTQSLVGAKELPSAEALSRETLYISRGGGPYGGHSLSYEWRPNDSITVTHDFSDGRGGGETRGSENLRISSEVAAEARRLLWRVRPAKFEGVENYGTRPIGCERKGPHDFGEVAVAFINEGQSRGREDDQIGIFELPDRQSCNTPAAVEARKVMQRVLKLLPRSNVTAENERSG